jgi:hypothetical protein
VNPADGPEHQQNEIAEFATAIDFCEWKIILSK